MLKPDGNELRALVTLLDDTDKEVVEHVVSRLTSLGPEIIPNLEQEWENNNNPGVHRRIEEIISIIQNDSLFSALKEWALNHSDNLLQGAILVARHQYAEIDVLRIQNQVEKLRKEIWIEMNYNLTALEQVNVFNHVFYGMNGFRPVETELSKPADCYIHHLLETKHGNAVSLGLLYLILAAQLQMPVYGVDLPQHFILSCHNHPIQSDQNEQEIKSDIIFYINPLNKGMIFSRDDISHYLQKMEIKPVASHYLPCDNKQVIRALIICLMNSYELQNDRLKIKQLKKMLSAVV